MRFFRRVVGILYLSSNAMLECECVIGTCLWWGGVFVLHRAIFHGGCVHREPQEFLFGLRIWHAEFDIWITRQGTHEDLQAVVRVMGECRVQGMGVRLD